MSVPDSPRVRAYSSFAGAPAPAAVSPGDIVMLSKRYGELVQRWARRFAATSASVVDWEDLVSVGMMGLLIAHQRFDPNVGKPFETYAEFRIKGAMLDELRRVDPFSQPHRRKIRRIVRAVEELTNELGHPPDDAALADHLEFTVHQVRELMQEVELTRHASFEEFDRRVLARDLSISGWTRADLEIALTRAIETLDKRNQTLLALYYFEGLSMAEISRVMGLTEARISQLHSATIKTLREAITGSATLPAR